MVPCNVAIAAVVQLSKATTPEASGKDQVRLAVGRPIRSKVTSAVVLKD